MKSNLYALLIAVLAGGSCPAQQVNVNNTVTVVVVPPPSPPPGGHGCPDDDDAIYNCVVIKLASDATVKGKGLKVEVRDRVVTLSGSVDGAKRRIRAAKLAKEVKHVKRVINNIALN